MAIDVDTWKKLKEKVDTAKTERDKAEGTLSHLRRRLENEFGCKTVEELAKKRADVEEEILNKTAAFNRQLTEFQEKWEEKL